MKCPRDIILNSFDYVEMFTNLCGDDFVYVLVIVTRIYEVSVGMSRISIDLSCSHWNRW